MTDQAPASSQQPKPGWQRWRIRRDFIAQGNKWDITHDCGWSARVDIGDNPHAIVEAELAHEQDCPMSDGNDRALVVDLTSWDALRADYWTCNIRFAMGIPVYDDYSGWPEPTRVCRGVTPLFFKTCLRCAMPRRWEKQRPGREQNPAWRPAA